MSSVRHVSGADFRYLFHNINKASIDTPRVINAIYDSYVNKKIPTQFHDSHQGQVKPVRMDYRPRLNILNY